MRVRAEIVGGPHDGETASVDPRRPYRVALIIRPNGDPTDADDGLQFVEMVPRQTPLGWRLYWPSTR